MRQLPKGISNYEDIVRENRIYVDKTMYIEKLEKLSDKTIMFLRPRKFGKTLFTSTLECYYDINKQDRFDKLFKNTYIGKNPTDNKNKYCILRFNFSGITTNTFEETIKGFREKVDLGINAFVEYYSLDFYNNPEQSTEGILGSLFQAFRFQKKDQKIYVLIDEYDHFANELLGFKTDEFKELVAKNGKIRKWYEVLKEGTETVVDRIFITGVAPITLDSTTSGFNIANDITKNILFNDMLGFSKEDVIYLMNELEIPEEKQKELLPIIKTNYDGYIFSNMIKDNLENYKMYNSNMTLYFLDMYKIQNEIPQELVDINIISDYGKIESFMDLCQNMNKIELLEKIVAGDLIESDLTEKFNAEIEFGEKELVSLLFYLGYLTIKEIDFGVLEFGSPNDVIRKIYSDYFLEYIKRRSGLTDEINQKDILKEIVLASDKNVKKRKFATGLSSVMAVIMLIYTILCFMNSRIGYGIIGLLFSVFFIWIIINGANTFQKKVINIVHSKMDNKLTSGKREYCFDTDGITVSSDIGNGTNHWNAFKCWGIFRNYIYIRTIKNEMVLVNQNDLSENDVKELKSLLSQNLKEETL